MANISTQPTFFPRRLSEYCPAMQYAADINLGGDSRISFGAPALAVAAGILSAQSIASPGFVLQAASLLLSTMDAPYGRNLTYVASGAATSTILTDGWDYLGQPMSEQVTLNGATPVVGLKCFKYIRQITAGITAATTVNIGFGSSLGIPYRAIKVWTEESNSAPATVGTLTAPVLTDPATVSTGEPRGSYVTNTALDGVKVITATFAFANDVNAAGNGGLHGIAHFGN